MPGGKGNIKPEDGKQFSSEYQPEEKWTEKKAADLGKELISWMNSKDQHIFFEEFLILENDYYSELISYLCNKFTSFSKLIDRAKKIQEIKLYKFGVGDELNAAMTKFVLINEHNKIGDNSKVQHSGDINDNKQINLTINSAKGKKEIDLGKYKDDETKSTS
jgi:hypothetical protein